MTSLPRAFALSLAQLGDPAILKVLAKSLLVTLAILALLGAALWWGLSAAIDSYAAGYSEAGVLIAVLLAVLAAWFLFRIVALAVLQFFADEVVRAVEARHYPEHAASARNLPFREELANSARSTARVLLVNLIALPVALLLLVTGVGTVLLFWLVNAFLLGRELQDMVWLRHRAAPEDTAPISGVSRFLLGGVVAALLAIPFVNFLAPVLGAASATHMVHRARGRAGNA